MLPQQLKAGTTAVSNPWPPPGSTAAGAASVGGNASLNRPWTSPSSSLCPDQLRHIEETVDRKVQEAMQVVLEEFRLIVTTCENKFSVQLSVEQQAREMAMVEIRRDLDVQIGVATRAAEQAAVASVVDITRSTVAAAAQLQALHELERDTAKKEGEEFRRDMEELKMKLAAESDVTLEEVAGMSFRLGSLRGEISEVRGRLDELVTDGGPSSGLEAVLEDCRQLVDERICPVLREGAELTRFLGTHWAERGNQSCTGAMCIDSSSGAAELGRYDGKTPASGTEGSSPDVIAGMTTQKTGG